MKKFGEGQQPFHAIIDIPEGDSQELTTVTDQALNSLYGELFNLLQTHGINPTTTTNADLKQVARAVWAAVNAGNLFVDTGGDNVKKLTHFKGKDFLYRNGNSNDNGFIIEFLNKVENTGAITVNVFDVENNQNHFNNVPLVNADLQDFAAKAIPANSMVKAYYDYNINKFIVITIYNSNMSDAFVFTAENKVLRNVSVQTVDSVADLAELQKSQGRIIYVKSYYAGLNKGGGQFIYDYAKSNTNNGVTVFNGWVRSNTKQLTPEMAGAKADGVSNDTAAFDRLLAVTKTFSLLEATYLANLVITKVFDITGVGMTKSILKAFDKTKPLIRYTEYGGSWDYAYLANCRLVGAGEREGDGFVFGDDIYKEGVALAGRVKFKDIYSYNFNRHMVKLWGNIGNTYDNVQFFKGNYGYWARSSRVQSPNNQLMHAGCDLFLGGQFCEFEKAGVLVFDTDDGGGQWTFINTIFEYNNGQPIYFDLEYAYANLWSPITLIACWYEENAKYPQVTIDTLAGQKTIDTVNGFLQNGGVYPSYYDFGQLAKIGTDKTKGVLNVWGNERAALAMYGGKFGASDATRLSFISDDDPAQREAAYIASKKINSGYDRDLSIVVNGKMAAFYGINNRVIIGYAGNAGESLGADNVLTLACYDGAAGGEEILNIKAGGGLPTRFHQADGVGVNPAQAVLKIGKVVATDRSINAAGTINAAGADYAEYMHKANNCGDIQKGDICGIDKDGLLTDIYDNAISFVVKSTNPSIVGGDNWFAEEPPVKTDENKDEYEKLLADFNNRLAKTRKNVDRVAFCGQVPVNVLNAKVGEYILAENKKGKIASRAVSNPCYEEYIKAVGKVIKIIDEKTALVIIKII